jgi:CopA family copper-resistance protein
VIPTVGRVLNVALFLLGFHFCVQTLASEETNVKLIISQIAFNVESRHANAIVINGTVPGPLIRLKEGHNAVIHVRNDLKETTSIHWHGILVPPAMDGVPGVSFAGIKAGETFTYRFPVNQSGTYWYHSHSGGQELMGMYGAVIIDPIAPDPFIYDRDYVLVLSDWTSLNPMTILKKLKSNASYFNFQKRTVSDFFTDISKMGLGKTLSNRFEWDKMRMDPTDLADVTASTYTYLMNGIPTSANWTGVFKKGEKIRLRFIAAAAMTIFDVRIPGVKLTIVQADGQNIQPVIVDEFRIAPGETYDVLAELLEEKPYTIFAEALDRSGFVAGTLAPKAGMHGEIPVQRKRVARTMMDMGMSMPMPMPMKNGAVEMAMDDGMNMQGMKKMFPVTQSEIPGSVPVKHGPDHHGASNSTVPDETRSRLHESGIGLGADGRRVLTYKDLKAIKPNPDQSSPVREIELHLTGNMERYMWSIDGKTYSENPEPLSFRYGQKLRLTLVNDTMMEHPMHLHGMWMYLENGSGDYLPKKHTIIVKPAERISVIVKPDAKGDWAFHCHMLLHMEMGMFRVVRVADDHHESRHP